MLFIYSCAYFIALFNQLTKSIFYRLIGILFKFKGEFSNQKNLQQFYHTFLKLN